MESSALTDDGSRNSLLPSQDTVTGVDGGAIQGGKHAIFMELSLPGQSGLGRRADRDESPMDRVLEAHADHESQLLFRKPGLSLLGV